MATGKTEEKGQTAAMKAAKEEQAAKLAARKAAKSAAKVLAGTPLATQLPLTEQIGPPKALDNLESAVAKKREKDKEEKDEKAQAGRTDAARKKRVKEIVYEFERTNRSKLVAFYSGKGWHLMGGNSAIIYANAIAPRIEWGVNMLVDRDLYYTFEKGVVSIKHLDALKTALAKIGISVESEDENVTVFDLGHTYTAPEMRALQASREEEMKLINQIVEVKELYPEIAQRMRRLAKEFRGVLCKAQQFDRELLITDMTRGMFDAVKELAEISYGYTPPKEGLKKILRRNRGAQLYIMVLMETAAMGRERVRTLGMQLGEVNRLIQAEIKKIENKEKEEAKKAEEAAEAGSEAGSEAGDASSEAAEAEEAEDAGA